MNTTKHARRSAALASANSVLKGKKMPAPKRADFDTPHEVTDADCAFPARAMDLMPEYSHIPDEFKLSAHPWAQWQAECCYVGVPGVDPWDEARDARKYAGPWPVVAHPPCDRWCQMAPVNQARYGHKVGDDGGCFDAALRAVRAFGGVLEHPALSIAWRTFDLPHPPTSGAWVMTMCGGWTCQVEQRHYGHRARKATWLYAYGMTPPPLKWGRGPTPEAWISADRPRAELAARGIAQLSKREAKATPPQFRDLLLSIARKAHNGAH